MKKKAKKHRSPAPKKRNITFKRFKKKAVAKKSAKKKRWARIIVNLDGQENRKALRKIFRGTIPTHGKLILAAR